MYSHNSSKAYFINSFNSIQETNEFLNPPPGNLSVADNGRSNHIASRILMSTIEYQPGPLSTTQQRPIIPSKRAAQNRAAQKAFRKRREQHIKDLEVKVKQLDSWKQQLDILRNENNELKDKMMDLEKQVDTLSSRNKLHNNSIVGATPLFHQQEHRSMSLPSSSRNGNSLMKRATTSNKRSYSKSNGGESSLRLKKDSRPLPTPLSHQTGFNNQLCNTDSSTTHRQLHDYNKRRKMAHQQESVIGQAPIQMMADNNADLIIIDRNHETQLMNENDFDPFFHQEELFAIGTNNEFVPTSGGQVLDDLFSMLQTRQRPQIPMLTTFANSQDNSPTNLI